MSSHTPGPWEVMERPAPASGDAPRVKGGGYEIARCLEPAADRKANARLIAAAPDLLDAAREAQCACSIKERVSGHLTDCWMPALLDAIAKAEGVVEEVRA